MKRCDECGASVPESGACMDFFHQMLLVEHQYIATLDAASSEQGKIAHFYAVSTYILQHPISMSYTVEALAGLRKNLAAHLAGRVTLGQVLTETGRASAGPARITRRAGDEVPQWDVRTWPMTVPDVVAAGAPGYLERVAAWAASSLRALEAVSP